jgi:glycosyltransferase involved in cell wall biosynthesis
MRAMKVALVCDSMSAYGGAERVIEQLLKLYPTADIFTVLDAVPKGQRGFLQGRTVHSSSLQSLPFIERYYRALLHFWPLAVEQLDVTDYDLVISSHHSVAYGVLTRPGQVHVAYVHTPMRYAWDLQHAYLRGASLDHGLGSLLARRTLHKVRMWDYTAAQRPDALAANSHFIAERIWKIHRRRAEVVHPPVAIQDLRGSCAKGDFYLSVGRLVPYKRVDLLVRSFALMPHRQLKVIGEGPEMRRIAALAGPNVELLGYQPEAVVHQMLADARAFLFAGIEDFGISAVEAQAAGTPVIAYGQGGLLEIVRGLDHPQPTGLFFPEQCEASVVAAVESFERQAGQFGAEACIANAMRFSQARFHETFSTFVEQAMLTRWRGDRSWSVPAQGSSLQAQPQRALTTVPGSL